MFEQLEASKVSVGVKIIVASVVGFLLSLGLCGLGSAMNKQGLGTLAGIGAVVFVFSVLGFLVGVLVAIVEGIVSLFGRNRE